MNIHKRIIRYEKSQRWNDAIFGLIQYWYLDIGNRELTIHLGILCWYVLLFWDEIKNDKIDKDATYKFLHETTRYGLEHDYEDEEFLWKFGFMMKSHPYYFGEYNEWSSKGIKMIAKAYKKNPNDPIIRMLYFEDDSSKTKEYKEACLKVCEVLEERFPGKGPLELYFKKELNRC